VEQSFLKNSVENAYLHLQPQLGNFGPAFTKAFPASFPVNLLKFLMKRPARS
jgi:hypothetical protein